MTDSAKRADASNNKSPEERAIEKLRRQHERMERDAKLAFAAATEARLKGDQLSYQASNLQDILSTYDIAKRREADEAHEFLVNAAKSATNTAPAPVSDPTQAIAAEAKEVWDAAWKAAKDWYLPLNKVDVNATRRDAMFNAYLKEQGDA